MQSFGHRFGRWFSAYGSSIAFGESVNLECELLEIGNLGCGFVAQLTSGGLSVEQNILESLHLSLYPMPNDGHFVIQLTDDIGFVAIQVFNASGVLVHEESERYGKTIELNLRGLVDGLFTIRLSTKDGLAAQARVVVAQP